LRLFTLSNGRGLEAEIADRGGIVKALRVPDRHGRAEDVVLGFDGLDRYLGPHPYFGGIIGRFGNRIARGRFRLNGRACVLARNDGANHLHGGVRGFDRVDWTPKPGTTESGTTLCLRYTSVDGEEGYPGQLACEVSYSLTAAGEFRIDASATTDRPTIVNLTHHSYFNLTGVGGADILGHHLQVDADEFLPVDEGLIPLGPRRRVDGTPFDLRRGARLGEVLGVADPQLTLGRGFDHCFVLNQPPLPVPQPRKAARVIEPVSGRVMEVLTTEPGLQVYTGGALDGTIVGKRAEPYRRHAGLCLEAQHFPDSPNQPDYPSVRLEPGEEYRTATIYRFSVAS
jgi:aldose 1-epimerase